MNESNVIYEWLATDTDATAVAFDLQRAWDDDARAFLARCVGEGRMEFFEGSVTDRADWDALAATDGGKFTHIVSGAALTPTASEEQASGGISAILSVNLLGLMNCLEFALAHGADSCRFISISSGAIYRHAGLVRPRAEGETVPSSMEMYTLTKFAGEQLVARFADLHGLDCTCVRPSNVFGRMDRDTGARNRHNSPYWVCTRAAASQAVVVSGGLDAVGGEHTSVVDLAAAIVAILRAQTAPRRRVYHIGLGRPVKHREILEAVFACVPSKETASLGELIEAGAIELIAPTDDSTFVNDGGRVHLDPLDATTHPLCSTDADVRAVVDISALAGACIRLSNDLFAVENPQTGAD